MTADARSSSTATTPDDLATVARRAIGLVDLTSLNEDDDEGTVAAICDKALTPLGPVAAVCIMPAFASFAARRLDGTPVRVATVANFPGGANDLEAAVRETAAAVDAGADEVDVVAPWRAWLDGTHEAAVALVRACRDACGDRATLKVILEAGQMPDERAVRALAADAIRGGAQFVKTSTGKVGGGATPEAARAMLEAIREAGGTVGFKASGGVRTTEQAAAYLALADELLGADWATAQTFRFGASGLLDDLLRRAAP
jgi:deoxyribose-phosphate aldolase